MTLGRESPQEIDGILVTCNYFDVLGVSPAIGTGFTPANCGTPDAPPVVVLESRALDRAPSAAIRASSQRPIVLNGREVTVVGVAPAGFDGVDMAKAAFFAPTSMAGVFRPEQNLHENPHVSWLTLIGRRRDDADTRAGAGGSLGGRESHRSAATGSHDVADRRTGGRPVAAGRAARRCSRARASSWRRSGSCC